MMYNKGSMTISKAHWGTDGDAVHISMPFSKVDQQRRIVSGFATLDNVDKQNDIVTTDASLDAFKRFRGNIREMHQPTAVGKMVSFKEDKYFDPETNKFYTGVYVSAYVSKGAQDTWEKVLDGTYTGFSIGGRMVKWDDAYDEKMDSQIRVIKKYDLVELSLVDNPANQFASILSIEKVDGADVLKGESVDVSLENVFWDADSGLVLLSDNDVELHPTSGVAMKNIGFVEKSDSEKTDLIKFLVESAKNTNNTEINKEVSPMAEATEAVEETVVEESEVALEVETAVETVEVEKAEEADDATTEKADSVQDEVVVEAVEAVEDVAKSDEAIVEAVAETNDVLKSVLGDLVDTVKALSAEVSEMKKSFEAVTGDVEKVSADVAKAASGVAEVKEEFGKRFDEVVADTAFRKSGDLGEIVQDQPELVEKSLWGGRFLKTADLFK
jgi:hypothetical protein